MYYTLLRNIADWKLGRFTQCRVMNYQVVTGDYMVSLYNQPACQVKADFSLNCRHSVLIDVFCCTFLYSTHGVMV